MDFLSLSSAHIKCGGESVDMVGAHGMIFNADRPLPIEYV
jgi:hypothetical protein